MTFVKTQRHQNGLIPGNLIALKMPKIFNQLTDKKDLQKDECVNDNQSVDIAVMISNTKKSGNR